MTQCVDPIKYKSALEVIVATKGLLADDTYLEKMVTETAAVLLKDNSNLWTSLGCSSLVRNALSRQSFEDAPAVVSFALSLLSECMATNSHILEEAMTISENLLANTKEIFTLVSSAKFLQLQQRLVNVVGVEWAERTGLWHKLILPLLADSPEESIFWTRQLRDLAHETLMAKVERGEVAEAAKHLEQILGLVEDDVKVAVEVLTLVLESLVSRHGIPSSPKRKKVLQIVLPLTDNVPSIATYPRIVLLVKALQGFDLAASAIEQELINWSRRKDSSCSAIDVVLRTLVFLDAVSPVEFKGCLEVCLNVLKCDSRETKSFSRTTVLLRRTSRSLAKHDDLRDVFLEHVAELVQLVSEEASKLDISSHEEKLLMSRCLNCLEESVELMSPALGLRSWDILARLLDQRSTSSQLQATILATMKKLAPALESERPSIHEMFVNLWVLGTSSDWSVADGFLELLGVCLRSFSVDVSSATPIIAIVDKCLSSPNAFVRSSAVDAVGKMTSVRSVWAVYEESFDIASFMDKFLGDPEFVVRRSAARFAKEYFNGEPDCEYSRVLGYLLLALLDDDTPVKEDVMQIFACMLEKLTSTCNVAKAPYEFLGRLEETRLSDAIGLAMRDYDDCVVGRARSMLVKVRSSLAQAPGFVLADEHLPSKRFRNGQESANLGLSEISEGARDDVIENIVNTSASSMLSALEIVEGADKTAKRLETWTAGRILRTNADSLVGLLSRLESPDEDGQTPADLNSLLDDIALSVSEMNQIDLIDCTA